MHTPTGSPVNVRLVTRQGTRSVEVVKGATLLRAARVAGLPMGASCRGLGLCGWCRVRVLDGATGLSPPGEAELLLLERLGADPDERIGCLATVLVGDISVTTGYW